MSDLIVGLMDEAREIERRHAEQAAKVRNNRELSIEGKAKRLAEIEAARVKAVEELRADAERRLDDSRQMAMRRLGEERKRLSEERRALLGDQLFAELLRTELSIADAAEIRQRYETAGTPLERELVRTFGGAELRKRTGERPPTVPELQALQTLQQAAPEGVRKLETEIRRIDDFKLRELDRTAEAHRIADAFGVKVGFVQVDPE